MDKFVGNTNLLLRQVLSGFVALATAWMIHPKEFAVFLKSVDSLWPIFALATLIGAFIYAVHSTIVIPFISILFTQYPVVYLSQRKVRPGSVGFAKRLRDVKDGWDAIVLERWRMRGSDDAMKRSTQKEIDRWSANVHFMYCSALGIVGAALFLRMEGNPLNGASIWFGLAVFITAALGDAHKCKRELDIQDLLAKAQKTN